MEFPSEDTVEQTRQALTNMGAILEEAGSSFSDGGSLSVSHLLTELAVLSPPCTVVKVTVLLDDIGDFTRVNDVYKTCM